MEKQVTAIFKEWDNDSVGAADYSTKCDGDTENTGCCPLKYTNLFPQSPERTRALGKRGNHSSWLSEAFRPRDDAQHLHKQTLFVLVTDSPKGPSLPK